MTRERRQSPRRPTRIEATVVCGDGLVRIPAVVIDRSEEGVHIRLAEEETLGPGCYLLFEHRIEPFRVVWQASRSAGLMFLN